MFREIVQVIDGVEDVSAIPIQMSLDATALNGRLATLKVDESERWQSVPDISFSGSLVNHAKYFNISFLYFM